MPNQLTIKQIAPTLKIQGQMVTLSLADFSKLAEMIADYLIVDEKWYLEQYPDVKAAIEKRAFFSGTDHFRRHGFLEGRMSAPQSFDEAWYLATYPDVAEAVRDGLFKSGRDHFMTAGLFEGRMPSKS